MTRLLSLIAAAACAISFNATPVKANAVATDIVNQYRAQQGQRGLKYSKKLEKIARAHALDIQSRGVLTHESANGQTPGKRLSANRYKWCYVSENLAQGPWDLPGVIRAWAGSKYHAKNMFNGKAKEFGIYQTEAGYWVMVLAQPGCR